MPLSKKQLRKSRKSKRSKRSRKSKIMIGGANLKISTFNILASGNTHYLWRSHKNINEELDDYYYEKNILTKKTKDIESIEQSQQRYNIVSQQIIDTNSDIVCLQECEELFFDPSLNPKSDLINEKYTRFDNLSSIPIKKSSGGGVSLLVNKNANIKSIFDPIFTEPEIYGGFSKGAVLLPIVDQNDNPCWIVSAHFKMPSEFRTLLVEKIDELYLNNPHPSGIDKTPILYVLGDFNVEGEGSANAIPPRRDYMAMEYKLIKNTSRYISQIDSIWYNYDCHIKNSAFTGLDGVLKKEKNIDHIFVYPPNIYNFNVDVLEEPNIYGPYDEDSSFSKRIGQNANFKEIRIEDVEEFLDSEEGPSEIVRGSDHKMVTLIISN